MTRLSKRLDRVEETLNPSETMALWLVEAKKQHLQVQQLDETLFAHDFEV